MTKKSIPELYSEFLENGGTSKKKNIILIDGLNLFIRNYETNPRIDNNGNLIGGVYGFYNSMKAIIKRYTPDELVVVFDGKGGSLRRKKLLKDYKSYRMPSFKYNRFEDTKGRIDEGSERNNQIYELFESLTYLPIHVIAIDYIEADDCISYICNNVYGSEDYLKIIVSSDKDFLHLIKEDVFVYSHTKKDLVDEKKMFEEYGYLPLNYLTLRCFTGDRSDNIKGIKYVGETGLKKHFNLDSKDTHISVEDIIKKSEEFLREGKKDKIFDNILGNRLNIDRNYNLMQLIDPPISSINKSLISDILEKPVNKFDYVSFLNKLIDYGYYVDNIEKEFWLRAFKK